MVENIADKKRAIFESTLSLIKDHGFHGAPMSLVAKNAGVAAGTIYHYFESKEKLICELYKYNRKLVSSVIASSLEQGGSYREKFFRVWTSLYRFYIAEPNVLIFFEQFVNSPYNVDKHLNHFRGELYAFFAEGIKQRELKSLKPEILLVLVLGCISATAKLHLFGNVSLNKTDLQKIVEVCWDGISLSKTSGA
jgi:TetR/AcrR family transcriptional regulator, multidrug resistance operon repressor